MSRTLNLINNKGENLSYADFNVPKFLKNILGIYEKKDLYMKTIIEQLELTLFDGMTVKELYESLVQASLSNIKDDYHYDGISRDILRASLYETVIGIRDIDEINFAQHYQNSFLSYVKQGIEMGVLDNRMNTLFKSEEIMKAINPGRDGIFLFSGISTLLDRYSIRGKNGEYHELPQFVFMRVAMGLSFKEIDPTTAAIAFYESISKLEYLPGGSTFVGAGTTRSSLSNCFLIQMEDDIEHISDTVSNVLKISKATGGIGCSITKLRATGSRLSSNNTYSSGPTPFAKIIDASIRAIIRGGKKVGALCFYMEPWHYDFYEFIDWRHNAGDDYMRMRTANTAAYIPDYFMTQVIRGGDWYFFDPKETPDLIELYGKAWEEKYIEYTVLAEKGEMVMWKKDSARSVYRKMLVSLQTTSHPWLVWKDTINNRALNNNTGTIHMSNLCTEITLPQDRDNISVCNLASLNLMSFFDKETKSFNFDAMNRVTKLAIRHLDNLIDNNVLPIEEARKSDKENRALGLGAMGLSELFECMGYSYDSDEAAELTNKIFESISYHAISSSCDLAEDRGSYNYFEGSGWSKGMVPLDTFLDSPYGEHHMMDHHESLDWNTLRSRVKKGMRNATLLAIAPNANIGLVGGTTPGIDVRFTQVFARNKFSGKYMDINHNLMQSLMDLGIWDEVKQEIISKQGDISRIENIPESLKQIYKTSFTTDAKKTLMIAGIAQKWVDQAISRNVYLEDRDIDNMMNLYIYAWNIGLKSTYYLHMKPRHTGEQSTVSVNKGASLGLRGFGGMKKDIEVKQEIVHELSAPIPAITESKMLFKSAVYDNSGNMIACPIDPAEAAQCDSCQ